jgi:hypothetical protein
MAMCGDQLFRLSNAVRAEVGAPAEPQSVREGVYGRVLKINGGRVAIGSQHAGGIWTVQRESVEVDVERASVAKLESRLLKW